MQNSIKVVFICAFVTRLSFNCVIRFHNLLTGHIGTLGITVNKILSMNDQIPQTFDSSVTWTQWVSQYKKIQQLRFTCMFLTTNKQVNK